MKVGDLVWMPPDDQLHGAVPVESELVCGLILSEPDTPKGAPASFSMARIQVMWTDPDGTVAIDWEPVSWLEVLSCKTGQVMV